MVGLLIWHLFMDNLSTILVVFIVFAFFYWLILKFKK
jgi:hypothetical protein